LGYWQGCALEFLPSCEGRLQMEKDVEFTFTKLAGVMAAQIKINADLRAEMEALISTLIEHQNDFRSRFELHLVLT